MRIDRNQKIIKRISQRKLSKLIPDHNGNRCLDLPTIGESMRYSVRFTEEYDIVYIALHIN